MWRKILGTLLLLAASVCAQEKFDLDWAHSYVGFTIGFMGLTKVEGRFTQYSGTILYDEADLTRSSVTAVIRAASINTGVEFRDKHLRSEDFFDVEKYPVIVFQSARVEKKGDGFLAVGNLSLHGVTREVAIPFRRVHGAMKDMWENTRVGFEGRLQLDRREFGIVAKPNWERVLDMGRLTIANEVEIILHIQGRVWNWERINLQEKSAGAAFWKTLEEQGLDAAVAQYRQAKEGKTENDLNVVGYKLLGRKKFREAIEVLKLNVEAYPKSANVYDSLADAFYAAGDREAALQNYKKSLELNPTNANALEMLRRLAGS